jgi:biopolymer transport protein ExbB
VIFQLIEKGGFVMYPLILCSIIALTFVIERFIFWSADMKGSESGEIENYLEHLRRGNDKEFLRNAQASKNPIAITLARSLSHGEKTLSEALSLEIDLTVEKTRRSLTVLDTCVTLTPLLGIFGTVTGIIKSFELMGGVGFADPHAVSAGIAEALLTTATGLAIAMPCLIFYNYFSAKSDRFTFRLEKYAREFEILYSHVNNRKGRSALDENNLKASYNAN